MISDSFSRIFMDFHRFSWIFTRENRENRENREKS